MVRALAAALVFILTTAIEAPAYGSITGNVYDVHYKAVKSARMELVEVFSGKIVATVISDADGKFLFSDLRPGNYAIVATAPQACTITEAIHVTAGSLLFEPLQLKDRLPCGGRVRFLRF